jgi:hypothetical protein
VSLEKRGIVVCTRSEFVRDYLDGKVDRYERVTDGDVATRGDSAAVFPFRLVELADPVRGPARWGGEYAGAPAPGEEPLGQFTVGVPYGATP